MTLGVFLCLSAHALARHCHIFVVQVDLLCHPAFPPLIPLSTAASAISHGMVSFSAMALSRDVSQFSKRFFITQVVAMEMQQCEYRAVIPSSLACGTSSFFGSSLRFIFDVLIWMFKCAVSLIVFLLIGLAISASTGYGSRYVPSLPEVIACCLCCAMRFIFCAAFANDTRQNIWQEVSRKPQARRWYLNGI